MLAFLYTTTRPKPWILTSLSSFLLLHHHHRLPPSSLHLGAGAGAAVSSRRRHHASASSVWHAILPSRSDLRRPPALKGEGSWNAAWDSRPARWLHRTDSAWFLFGVRSCLSPLPTVDNDDTIGFTELKDSSSSSGCDNKVEVDDAVSSDYRVTGVLADGRCLFRAIAHGACLRNGEEAPDENRQRELADELRAQVVDELMRRREETEWFIEGDFDAYVKRIQLPYVWGGEPELLMASHVLKTRISVFMRERKSGDMVNIANYGEEYKKEKEDPINVLFHGYGHYDLLETLSNRNCLNINAQELGALVPHLPYTVKEPTGQELISA